MTNICNAVHGLKPVMAMVLVQIAFGGVNVLYKLAVRDGMSLRLLVAYRFLFATAFIAPIALVFERKNRPKMTWTVLFQSFLSGLFGGALAQNLYLEAIALTSATFASSMSNLIPAFTFIMAICFRLENFNLGTSAGMAKILGTLIGIGGAMILTFFKGAEINIGSLHSNLLLHHQNGHAASSPASSGSNTLLGFFFALGSCCSYALWLIVQAKMGEKYPCYYSSTALMSLNGAIVAIIYALCLERDWSQWRLGWNVRLLTVVYSGVVASGIVVVVIAWCIHMRGPLFVSVFSPLVLVTVAVSCSLLLDEKLYLGSIIGAVLIVLGLYMVLWGKGKEMRKKNQLVPAAQSPSHSDIVEILVDNKSNRNSSTQNEANLVVSDHDESSE